MAWRKVASFVVPLVDNLRLRKTEDRVGQYLPPLTTHQQGRLLAFNKKKTDPFAVTKPNGRLGAGWIDDFVSRRRNVVLCETCQLRYSNWYEKVNYKGDNIRWFSNCDGCKEWIVCNGFYPGENISKILDRRFWKEEPRKRLFFSNWRN